MANIIKEAINKKLDMPLAALYNLPYVELTGNREVLIENHKGIIEYGSEQIRVKGATVDVKVEGVNLFLKKLNKGAIVVAGEITNVEFC